MSSRTVSLTALGTVAGRALETRRPAGERLFADPFAMDLLPALHRAIVRVASMPVLGPCLLSVRERRVPGIMGNLVCRTRYIDDAFRKALASGCEQALIIGAGGDSRAHRIDEADGITIFEVDHPLTQAWKRERMARSVDRTDDRVIYVPVALGEEDLRASLVRVGFCTDVRTVVIWEGVTQYLDFAAIDATLRCLASVLAAGSTLIVTYIRRGVLHGAPGARFIPHLLAEMERIGEPWLTGFEPDELSSELAAHGLSIVADVGAAEYRAEYLDPIGRDLALFESERVAVALKGS